MASIQSQVIAAVVAALSGTAYPAYRCRFEPFAVKDPVSGAPGDLPAYNVIPEDGMPDEESAETWPTQAREFSFNVRHSAFAVNAVDAVVDALYVAGVQALMASPTLGGLVRMIYEGEQKWEMEPQGGYNIVTLVVKFTVKFATLRSDPSTGVS